MQSRAVYWFVHLFLIHNLSREVEFCLFQHHSLPWFLSVFAIVVVIVITVVVVEYSYYKRTKSKWFWFSLSANGKYAIWVLSQLVYVLFFFSIAEAENKTSTKGIWRNIQKKVTVGRIYIDLSIQNASTLHLAYQS